jgi:hypothetical protein
MRSPMDYPMGDDDLARQRRKREARLLDQQVAGFSGLTVADVVADVLAASDGGRAPLDVRGYLEAWGYGPQTIDAVIGYLRRQRQFEPPDSATTAAAVTHLPSIG